MKKVATSIMLCFCLVAFACTQNQLQTAENLTQAIIQDIPAILEILAGAGVLAQPALGQAQAAAGEASSDFSLVEGLISDFQKNPSPTTAAKIRTALADAQTHLQAVMAAAHVKNPQTQATITGALTLIINTANQIAAIFPMTPAGAAVKAANNVRLPSVPQFNSEMKKYLGK